jgi:hypothetical protein
MKSVIFLAFTVFTVPAFSAVIIQKNGDVISGKLLEETGERYIFQSPYGKLKIAKSNVAKFIRDEKIIELKNVEDGGKTVKARLINQDSKTAVYLTDDGRTIRKADAATADSPAQPQKDSRADKVLVGLFGGYGFSTYPESGVPETAPGQFNQAFHLNTLTAQLDGHYVFSRFLGFGLAATFHRWSGSESITAIQPDVSYDTTSTYMSIVAAPSVIVSVLGALGSGSANHDIRLVLQGGAAFNFATTSLQFKPKPGFPSVAEISGKGISPAIQGQIYYAYKFSESLKLRLGFGYFRAFYDKAYSGSLVSPTTIPGSPGGFKGDFENNITASIKNPQIISVIVGVEAGF